MTEPQMCENLHLHLLLWIEGLPRSTLSYSDLDAADQEKNEINSIDDGMSTDNDIVNEFNKSIINYVSSVVTNVLPLSLSPAYCESCNHSRELISLPILPEHKKKRNKFKCKNQLSVEPLLLQCKECGNKLSSQAAIGMALANERETLCWPPSLSPITSDELTNCIRIERRSRLDDEECIQTIEQRERIRQSSSSGSNRDSRQESHETL
jgi:hypothetical protein